jgi:hypothetical protein
MQMKWINSQTKESSTSHKQLSLTLKKFNESNEFCQVYYWIGQIKSEKGEKQRECRYQNGLWNATSFPERPWERGCVERSNRVTTECSNYQLHILFACPSCFALLEAEVLRFWLWKDNLNIELAVYLRWELESKKSHWTPVPSVNTN